MTGEPPRGAVRRVAFLVVVTVGLVLAVAASPAWSHSELARSDPPDGGMVAVGRSTLSLWFAEPVDAAADSFDLRTVDGDPVPLTAVTSRAANGGVAEIRTAPLARGTYVLAWRVLSLEDGHPSSGSLLFGVGMRPAVVSPAESRFPESGGLLARWLDLSALLLAIGSLAVAGRVLAATGEAGNARRRRARWVGAGAGVVAVASGVVTPFLRTQQGDSSVGAWLATTLTGLTDTPWGHLWLAREAVLVVAAAALVSLALHRVEDRTRVRVAAVALVVVALLEGVAGHASGLPSRSGLAAVVSATHVVAAGVWAGGLTVLALCLFPRLRRHRSGPAGPSLAPAWRAYSPRAAGSAVVLLATGIYESGRHLPDLQAVNGTVYGGAVAGKTALVLVALALAGINTLLVNRRLAASVGARLGRPPGWSPVPAHRFATVVAAEIAVLAVATGTAALLTSVPTGREVEAASRVSAPHTENVEGLFVTFEEVPAGPDRSRLIVRASPTVKPEPGPLAGADVLLVAPSGTSTSVALTQVEPGRYEAEVDAPGPGAWQAWVAVQRTGVPDAVMEVGWSVSATGDERPGRLEVVGTALAVVLLAGLGGVLAVTRRRAVPRTRAATGDRVTAGVG